VSRDRGSYGPLDRDQHFIVGWGSDRLAAHTYARTVGRVVQPILPMAILGVRAHRSADRLWTGARLTGGRVEAEKPLSRVGQEFFHTVADRTRALSMLTTSFQGLSNDLAVWQTANRDLPQATSTAQWIAADVTPTLDEWRQFFEHESRSWWSKLATNWETYEEWVTRLRQLRSMARAHGITLQSPEPVDLPKTIWQRGAEGKGSEAAALLGVLKIGAGVLLTVMGVVGIYEVVHKLRPKKPEDDRAVIRDVLREEMSRSTRR
jgi:hypothetical protein